jgi:hypothetical protein
MNREVHVRICEGLGVKFPGPTRQKCPKRLRLPGGKNTHEHMGRIVPQKVIPAPRLLSKDPSLSSKRLVSIGCSWPAKTGPRDLSHGRSFEGRRYFASKRSMRASMAPERARRRRLGCGLR